MAMTKLFVCQTGSIVQFLEYLILGQSPVKATFRINPRGKGTV